MAYKQLTDNQRFYIEKRLAEKVSKSQVARELGVFHTTIGREIKRNTDECFHGLYSHLVANTMSKARKIQASATKAFIAINEDVLGIIKAKLVVHTSPEVISGELKENNGINISKNTIYCYLSQDKTCGGLLYKDLPHSGKPYRPAKTSDASNVKIQDRVGIDTIYGKNQESFLLTIVDKASKFCIIRKLSNKCAQTVADAFKSIVSSTFFEFKAIISDNGLEFTYHKQISEATNADFFFARPYKSCDRGLNEHTNGLIRRFYPKGFDFNELTDEDITKLEFILNSRGRKSLGFKSPNQVFVNFLQSFEAGVLC